MLNEYDVLADAYQKTNSKPDKQCSILPTILSVIGDVRGRTILDVGCGDGFFTHAFADAGAKLVIGIDSSTRQIEKAVSLKRPNETFLIADMMTSSFPTVNVICAPFVLNYFSSIEDLRGFLRKLRLSLMENGRVMFVIDLPSGKDLTCYGAKKTFEEPLQDGSRIQNILFDRQGTRICSLNAFFYSRETICRLLQEVGFDRVEKIQPIVSTEGLATYGSEYWNEYLKDPELGYYLAFG